MVSRNNFVEISTDKLHDDSFDQIWELEEDILQMVNENLRRIVDLGWYPSHDPEGQYMLMVVELTDDKELQPEKWNEPLYTYCSRNGSDIRDQINYILQEANEGRM